MRKKLLIFCFTAVIAANVGTFSVFASDEKYSANDTVYQNVPVHDTFNENTDEIGGSSFVDRGIVMLTNEAPETPDNTAADIAAEETDIEGVSETADPSLTEAEEAVLQSDASADENGVSAETNAVLSEESVSKGKHNTAVVSEDDKKSKLSFAEYAIIVIMSCLSAFLGAGLMYAIMKKNQGGTMVGNINSEIDSIKRIKQNISKVRGIIDAPVVSGNTGVYEGKSLDVGVVVNNLENNISNIKELVSDISSHSVSDHGHMSSNRMNANKAEEYISPDMTVSDMFNKVSELRESENKKYFMDYNQSERKLIPTNKIDWKRDAEYILEKKGEDVWWLYINRTYFFNASDVSESLFDVKADGTIRGDVFFRPCIFVKNERITGRLG